VVKSAPQAKFFETQNAYLLEWQVFSKFKISILLVVKSALQAKFFETQNACFLKWKVLSQFNISIFSGQNAPQVTFF